MRTSKQFPIIDYTAPACLGLKIVSLILQIDFKRRNFQVEEKKIKFI